MYATTTVLIYDSLIHLNLATATVSMLKRVNFYFGFYYEYSTDLLINSDRRKERNFKKMIQWRLYIIMSKNQFQASCALPLQTWIHLVYVELWLHYLKPLEKSNQE